MLRHKKSLKLLTLTGTLLVVSLYWGSAWGQMTTVDCSIAQTIQDALDGGFDEIEITGTCIEDVEINRSGITLDGNSGGEIEGSVSVVGAHSVVIQNLTIRDSGGTGVGFVLGASGVVQDSAIEGHSGSGIDIRLNSVVILDGNTIGSNGGCGVFIVDGSNAVMQNNTVTSDVAPDFCDAVEINRDSSVRLRGNIITNTRPDGFAIGVFHASSLRQDGSGGTYVGAFRVLNMSYSDVRALDQTGDITVDLHSVLRIRNSDITGDVTVSRDSAVEFGRELTINGDVTCLDDESSSSGTFNQPANFKTSCTGFSAEAEKGRGRNSN